jgi:hypothetical protein
VARGGRMPSSFSLSVKLCFQRINILRDPGNWARPSSMDSYELDFIDMAEGILKKNDEIKGLNIASWKC